MLKSESADDKKICYVFAGFGSVEHKLHSQGNTVRSSRGTSVHQGLGAGRREPEVLLEGKNHLSAYSKSS